MAEEAEYKSSLTSEGVHCHCRLNGGGQACTAVENETLRVAKMCIH